jgi:hypothetical protein
LGVFALCAAAVLASGLELRRYSALLLIIIFAALLIAIRMPLDSHAWDSSLDMINGYQDMLRMANTGIAAVTVVSFLMASYIRGSKEYLCIALGAALAFLGRDILVSTDTWITLFPALAALVSGLWFMASRLHKIYLWL